MTLRLLPLFLAGLALLMAATVLVAALDLGLADRYYNAATRLFWLYDRPFSNAFHRSLKPLGYALGIGCIAGALVLALRARLSQAGALLFLLATLLLGPVLLVNEGLKNNSGRARPIHLTRYAGDAGAHYTAPLQATAQCRSNCSFVSGDASFGFWLHSIAYVLPGRRARRIAFWSGMGAGVFLGWLRIAAGAHFLSDVAFAGAAMLASSFAIACLSFGPREAWRRLASADIRLGALRLGGWRKGVPAR